MQSALSSCQKELKNTAGSDQVINSLKLDWEKFSKILPSSQNELLQDDFKLIGCTSKTYCETLLHNLEDRFPEPKILSAFRIFEAKEIPLDANQRQLYGNHDLKLLITRFNVVSAEQTLKVVNDHQILKDRMIMPEFGYCRDSGAVCSKIVRDENLREIFPELHRLCCIALSIPLATAWPERGFSTLCRGKTKQRSRLLDVTLNALINVSMNGPAQLNDESALEIAQKWTEAENRRRVTERALKTVNSTDDEEETDAFADEQELFNEVEIEKFVL